MKPAGQARPVDSSHRTVSDEKYAKCEKSDENVT